MVSTVITALIVLYSMIEHRQDMRKEINRLRLNVKTLNKIMANSNKQSKSYQQETGMAHNPEGKEMPYGLGGVASNLFDYFLFNRRMVIIKLIFKQCHN